jgi:hypothetical protein
MVNALPINNYYTTLIDDASATVSYVGKAQPGTLPSSQFWQIFKIDTSVSPLTDIEWASGNAKFDKVWDDRTTYNYF